ncbi:MAG: HAD family hydrolase [Anaerolineae bacterium]
MLRAILFDLDDTLLRTRTEAFIGRYFASLGEYLGAVADPRQLRGWIVQATQRMLEREHESETNVEAFGKEFEQLSGLSMATVWPQFWRFYTDVFPTLGDDIEPMPWARDAVVEAQQAGLKVVIATNPLFPLVAIRTRLAWAGLSDVQFDLITALDNMHFAKPQPRYFREAAAVIGVPESACLAVGNDPAHDIAPAKAAGMWTYLVVDGAAAPEAHAADATGDMGTFLQLLRRRQLPGMAA